MLSRFYSQAVNCEAPTMASDSCFFLPLHAARYCLLSAPAFQNVKVNTPSSEWRITNGSLDLDGRSRVENNILLFFFLLLLLLQESCCLFSAIIRQLMAVAAGPATFVLSL